MIDGERHMYYILFPRCFESSAVVYLPGENESDESMLVGSQLLLGRAIVFIPERPSAMDKTARAPWTNEVPHWIEPWISCCLKEYTG